MRKITVEVPEKIYPARTETVWETSDGQRFITEEQAEIREVSLTRASILKPVYRTEIDRDGGKYYYVRSLEELDALQSVHGAIIEGNMLTNFVPQWVVLNYGGEYGVTKIRNSAPYIQSLYDLLTTLTNDPYAR
jgi:hypothetical protein